MPEVNGLFAKGNGLMVLVLHRVAGRVRFKVDGLRGSGPLAAYLENRLEGQPGIKRVSASRTTGNVLVLFASTHTVEALAALIQDYMSAFQENRPSKAEQAGSRPSPFKLPIPADTKPPWISRMAGWVTLKSPQDGTPWHTMSTQEVLRLVGASIDKGLSDEDVEERRAGDGTNVLPGTFRRSLGSIFVNHISSLPVLLIATAAGLSVLTGRMVEGMIGMGVALVNAIIGCVAEAKAEQSLELARRTVELRARVLRNGSFFEVPFESLVIGDILDLQLGSRIPADARLLETGFLSVDESTLTGESVPVRKSSKPVSDAQIPISKRRNMVYRGTLVVEGSGRAVVVAISEDTVLGRLQGFLGEVFPPEAAIARGMKDIAFYLIMLGLGGCGILAMISLLRGYGLLRIARDTVAFLAWTLPSGLSTLALGAFALGIGDMRRNKILVRRLRALGNLASIQMVCFDKTGTLTLNRMTVQEVCAGATQVRFDESSSSRKKRIKALGQAPDILWLIKLAALCNEATIVQHAKDQSLEGSSTERAMIQLAEQVGMDFVELRKDFPIVEVRHRTDEHRFMITLHRRSDGRDITIVKGNPFEVMERCTHFQSDGKVSQLGEAERQNIEAENFRMAGSGLRVLGVAYQWGIGIGPEGTRIESWHLIWVGLIGLADPVRKGAKRLVQKLHRAGIRTAVITGDQSLTAHHIGESLGLSGGEPLRILDAADLRSLNDMESVVTRTHIFATLSPAQKLQIIQAYQRTGMGVVMVGDGINDVLALKVADVGIAMGRDGADIARRTADLVLEDDDLENIMAAIANGRAFYGNLRRSLRFLLTANQVDVLMEMAAKAGLIGVGPSVWQSVWTNAVCLSLALGPPNVESDSTLPADTDQVFAGVRDIEDTFKGAMGVLAGGSVAGLFGLARYGMQSQASHLFSTSVSINQLLYAETCQGTSGQGPEERHTNPYLRATTLGVVGWHLLSLFSTGLGTSIGRALLRTFDVVALGAGCLLSRTLLKGRAACDAPIEDEEDFE